MLLNDRIRSWKEQIGSQYDSRIGEVVSRICLNFLKRIDRGSAADVVYVDLKMAFDKVPHGRLVQMFRSHGIPGGLANCIQNWLGSRMQHW